MFEDIIESINEEIKELKQSRKKKYINVEFYKLSKKHDDNHFIYEIYVSEYISKMSEDITIELVSINHKVEAKIISIDENQLIKIQTLEKLVDEIYRINMEFDPSFLLKHLQSCVRIVNESKNKIVKLLEQKVPNINTFTIDKEPINGNLNDSQIDAIKYSEENEINIIWGPPGTGKTHTLSKIIYRSFKRNEKVLVLSTSNVALDQILLKLDSELTNTEKDSVFRYGQTSSKRCYEYTNESNSYKENTEKMVTFITLANLSLKYEKLSEYDLVVIDEVSMVSLPYVFVAANKSKRNLVMLGDFRQLPPISLAEDNFYFKESIFDYLKIPYKIDNKVEVPYMVMLDTQYRMNIKISNLISNVFYNKLLKCGTHEKYDNTLNFINVDNSSYKDTYLSITDLSYFNPISLPIVKNIINSLEEKDELLLLSPFRPQQNILNVLLIDNEVHGRSLTIHKAQGTESDIVVLDLTTYEKSNNENYHHFFISDITRNLINVAISRTKKKLFITGSLEMIKNLSLKYSLWDTLNKLILNEFNILDYITIHNKFKPFNIEKINLKYRKTFTVVDPEGNKKFYRYIKNAEDIEKRNYISLEGTIPSEERKVITFRDIGSKEKLPSMSFIDDKIILNENNKYISISGEKTSKVLQRIALEKYIDTVEVDRASTFTLSCDRCGDNFVLLNKNGVSYLNCNKCYNSKSIGLNEANLIKALYKIKCPDCGSDVIPRKAKKQFYYSFYGCSNFPHCRGSVPLWSYASNN